LAEFVGVEETATAAVSAVEEREVEAVLAAAANREVKAVWVQAERE